MELLLAESLRVAHEAGALRGQDLKRVTVDTTVQPKAITLAAAISKAAPATPPTSCSQQSATTSAVSSPGSENSCASS
ncbi:hypothetical protein ABIB10_007435 [Bradyrhizobium sp. RT3b]